MILIRYERYGEKVSDFDLEEWFAEIQELALRDHWCSRNVSTALPIHRVRVAIKEGIIPHESVKFKFEDYWLYPDKDGRMATWPQGFCDTFDCLLERLL